MMSTLSAMPSGRIISAPKKALSLSVVCGGNLNPSLFRPAIELMVLPDAQVSNLCIAGINRGQWICRKVGFVLFRNLRAFGCVFYCKTGGFYLRAQFVRFFKI